MTLPPETIFTDRFVLQVEQTEAAERVLQLYLRNRAQFEAFEPTRPDGFYTLDFHEKVLHREYNNYLSGTFLRYFIYDEDEPDYVLGAVNFNLRQDDEIFAEVGYKIDHSYWNRGIARETVTRSMDVLAAYYPVERFDARILPGNGASLHLVKKMGFVFMKDEPKSANILGKDVDIVRYTKRLGKN